MTLLFTVFNFFREARLLVLDSAKYSICLFVSLFSFSVFCGESLPFFNAYYTIQKSGVSFSNIRISYYKKGKHFFYESETQTNDFYSWIQDRNLLEKSQWNVVNHQIKPIKYQYTYYSNKNQRKVDLLFNWDDHIVKNTVGKKSWLLDINSQTQDKLSSQIALIQQLSKKGDEKSFKFSVADGGKLKSYQYVIIGEEEIATALGNYQAIKVELTKNNKITNTVIWFAPKLNYIPIAIQRKKYGINYNINIVQLDWLNVENK